MNGFLTWIRRVFQRMFGAPSTATPPKREPRQRPPASEGEFYFRESILDQLDGYFDILRRMRRGDADAYELYRRVGAHIVPNAAAKIIEETAPLAKLNSWWLRNRPGFGAICYPGLKELWQTEKVLNERGRHMHAVKFIYFRKYGKGKAPPTVQRVRDGDIYVVTIYWDDKKRGSPTEFGVAIDGNGNIRVLRTLDFTPLTSRGKGRRRGREFHIPHRQWTIGTFFKDWAAQAKEGPEDFLRRQFLIAATLFEVAQYSMIRVDVEQQGLHAVFGVDVTRTPHFFKDRDLTLNASGRRRRIFHIVKAHTRKNGADIKLHFRGEKKFNWNGYNVQITVPGRDHFHLAEFDVGVADEDRLTDDERIDSMSPGQVGAWLRTNLLNRHPGALNGR